MADSIRTLAFAGIICFMAVACYGPNVGTYPPATRPEGIPAWLHVANDSLPAELLSVEEDALLVLVLGADSVPHRLAGRLARIPFTALRRGIFAHAGDVVDSALGAAVYGGLLPIAVLLGDAGLHPSDFVGDGVPQAYVGSGDSIAADSETLRRLRLLSRFPQGVDDQLLARLEATYGDTVTLGAPDGDPLKATGTPS